MAHLHELRHLAVVVLLVYSQISEGLVCKCTDMPSFLDEMEPSLKEMMKSPPDGYLCREQKCDYRSEMLKEPYDQVLLPACSTTTASIENNNMVLYMCTFTIPQNQTMCQEFTDEEGTQTQMCNCGKDYCNAPAGEKPQSAGTGKPPTALPMWTVAGLFAVSASFTNNWL